MRAVAHAFDALAADTHRRWERRLRVFAACADAQLDDHRTQLAIYELRELEDAPGCPENLLRHATTACGVMRDQPPGPLG